MESIPKPRQWGSQVRITLGVFHGAPAKIEEDNDPGEVCCVAVPGSAGDKFMALIFNVSWD